MNVYFLVEGKRTERKVYPRWLYYLIPQLQQIQDPSEVKDNTYFLFSGEGYPSLLDNHLPNAIEDLIRFPRFGMLVVCLDAEESTVDSVFSSVQSRCQGKKPFKNGKCQLRVIVQNRCIESWFLGNTKMVPRSPQCPHLRKFLRFHNVRVDCPECMRNHPGFRNHAHFHGDYLRRLFISKHCCYSKDRPGPVLLENYLRELEHRVGKKRDQLPTFQAFLSLCRDIKGSMAS